MRIFLAFILMFGVAIGMDSAENQLGVDISDRSHDFFFQHIFPKTIPSFRIANEISNRIKNGEKDFVVDGIIKINISDSNINIENLITDQGFMCPSAEFVNEFGNWPEDPSDEISKEDYENWQIRQQWEREISEKYKRIIIAAHEIKRMKAESGIPSYTGEEDISDGDICVIQGNVSLISRIRLKEYAIGIKLGSGTIIRCILDSENAKGLFWLKLGDTMKIQGEIYASKNELLKANPLLINNITINIFRDEWNRVASEIISMGRTFYHSNLYPNPRNPRSLPVLVKEEKNTSTAWIETQAISYSGFTMEDAAIAIAIYFMDEEGGRIAFATLRDSATNRVIFEIAGIGNMQRF